MQNILREISVKLGIFKTLPGILKGLFKKWKIRMGEGGLMITEF